MGFFDGIVGAVAGPLIGGLLGSKGQESANATNMQIAQQTNEFNAQQAQANRDFEREMSNTSWQRGVKDMAAAGLNPMLAYGMGGASVPSGSQASGVSTHVENTMAPFSRALSSVSTSAAQVENTHADTEVKKAEAVQSVAAAEREKSSALLNAALADKARQDTLTSTASAANLAVQSDVARATVAKVVAETAHIGTLADQTKAMTQKILAETKNVPLQGSEIAAMIAQAYSIAARNRQDIAVRGPEQKAAEQGVPTGWSKWLPDVSSWVNSAQSGLQRMHDRSKFMQWMDKP